MKIKFNIAQETTVTSETVRISCLVQARIADHVTNKNLDQEVRGVLEQFIQPTGPAAWSFSNPTRGQDQFKVEVAAFQATIRVKMSENHDLTERAKEASLPNVQISSVSADPSVPARDVEDATAELRRKMTVRAQEECALFAADTKVKLKVAKVDFSPATDYAGNPKGLRMSATAAASSSYAPDAASIGHSQKITLAAEVTLAD